MLTPANTGKIGRGFGKNADEWTGRVEISKEAPHCVVAWIAFEVFPLHCVLCLGRAGVSGHSGYH